MHMSYASDKSFVGYRYRQKSIFSITHFFIHVYCRDQCTSPSEYPYASIVDDIRKYASQDSLPSEEEISENLGSVSW